MENVKYKNKGLNPFFVSGFLDAEGCFHLSIGKNSKYKTGYYVNPGFSIGLDLKDLDLLNKIQSYLGGIGRISKQSGKYLYRTIRHFTTYSNILAFNSVLPSAILNSWFITGFSDAESSFSVFVVKKSTFRVGWTVNASFQIGLDAKDKLLLDRIQAYFGVGKVYKAEKNVYRYMVRTLKELKIIIDHFDKFPLITQKKADFILFKKIVNLMDNKEHLTVLGVKKIVAIKASINRGLSNELKAAFPNTILVDRPLIQNEKNINPYWLAGFTSGEGYLRVKIISQSHNLTPQVQLEFKLIQHSKDELLMRSLLNYLKCGKIYNYRESVSFIVTKYEDLAGKIIPFFDNYKIEGVKAKDFSDFKQVLEMMKNKNHLTAEGLKKISEIKAGMNTGRK